MKITTAWLSINLLLPATCIAAESAHESFTTLQALQPGDSDMDAARAAAKKLQADTPNDFLSTLQAMKAATPIGRNWLSSIASTQYQNATKTDKSPLTDKLESFLADSEQAPEARTLVFHWLTDDDSDKRAKLLDTMLDDNSPELRFAAIEQAYRRLDRENPDKEILQRLLESARHPDQVRNIFTKLQRAGVDIDQATYLGFIQQWKLIGPFDNRQPEHFDMSYPVEADLIAGNFDESKTYESKDGTPAQWQTHVTEDVEGKVNLARLYDKEKGACIYAYATLQVDKNQPALVSLTTPNGSKAWFNGQLVLSNEIYHTGARLDQYVADVELKAGVNVLVLKIMQNEQSEPSAQEYQFHCRIADPTGRGIQFTQPN